MLHICLTARVPLFCSYHILRSSVIFLVNSFVVYEIVLDEKEESV